MLIKILSMDNDVVEALKEATGKSTGSGAVEAAAQAFIPNRDHLRRLEQQNAELQRKLDAALGAMARCRTAAADLLERASYADATAD